MIKNLVMKMMIIKKYRNLSKINKLKIQKMIKKLKLHLIYCLLNYLLNIVQGFKIVWRVKKFKLRINNKVKKKRKKKMN